MAVNTQARTKTWTYVDGDWLEGNPPLIGPVSHAMWLGSTVFDGARLVRWRRARSRPALPAGQPLGGCAGNARHHAGRAIEGLAREGLKKFDGKTAGLHQADVLGRAWRLHVGAGRSGVDAVCLCLFESPMIAPRVSSVTVSPFRRPTYETAPTNAKAGCLYPNNGRAVMEAKSRGIRQCAGAATNARAMSPETGTFQHLHGQGRRW